MRVILPLEESGAESMDPGINNSILFYSVASFQTVKDGGLKDVY